MEYAIFEFHSLRVLCFLPINPDLVYGMFFRFLVGTALLLLFGCLSAAMITKAWTCFAIDMGGEGTILVLARLATPQMVRALMCPARANSCASLCPLACTSTPSVTPSVICSVRSPMLLSTCFTIRLTLSTRSGRQLQGKHRCQGRLAPRHVLHVQHHVPLCVHCLVHLPFRLFPQLLARPGL